MTAWSTSVLAAGPARRLLAPVLVVLAVLLTWGRLAAPDVVPVSGLLLPVVVGAWRLSRRELTVLAAVVLLGLAVMVLAAPGAGSLVAALVVVLGTVLAFWYVGLREAWGFSAARGVAILLEVRDRLRQQGELPTDLPGWQLERVVASAADAALRGDFTLVAQQPGLLQLVVVDVSGHGPPAAARAMQLAGAFGGMLGEVPPSELVAATNRYVRRQGWDADYATLAHVELDPGTGILQARTAGHPRVLVRRGSGRWEVLPSAGPILGLVAGARFDGAAAQLRPADLALLLTDGALAERDDELSAAEALRRAVDRWVEAGAGSSFADVVAGLELGARDDDRTVVLVRRRPEHPQSNAW